MPPFPPNEIASLLCSPWFYFATGVAFFRGYLDGKATAFKEVEAETKKVAKEVRDYQVELRKSPEQTLKELKEGKVDWAEVKRRLKESR